MQRAQHHRPRGRQREHHRHDGRAGDDLGQQVADIRDEGVEGHPQRIFDQHLEGVQPLGAGRDDILLVQLIEQVGAQPADHGRRVGGADHQHRYPQMGQHGAQLPPGKRFPQVPGIHQPADGDAERDVGQVEQDQRQQEIGGGKAQKPQQGQAVVAPTVLVGGRIDPDRKGNHPCKQDGGNRHEEGQEHAVAHHFRHRQVVFERITEVAPEHAEQPGQVLLVGRAVHPELLAQKLDALPVHPFALGLQLHHVGGQVVAGRQLDDDEGEHADRQQIGHHQHQSVQGIADHGLTLPRWRRLFWR